MKKIFFYTFILLFVSIEFYSCDDDSNSTQNANNTSETTATQTVQDTSTSTTPFVKGKAVFNKTCITCHQPDGKGVIGVYPPLTHSDYLLADKERAIKQVLLGSNTMLTVNGKKFNSLMPPQELSDSEIADVLNYVYHTWGNNGFTITTAEVKTKRLSEKGK
ncbi:MAG TPA: cytochrome c [Bacteroidia bacterium]|nr:cytochrome c [Bacteroidia bacterium]